MGETVNRIPYIGWGGWYGIVTTACAHRDAAWDLLADFADPDKTGAETISAAKSGAGPFRLKHTDQRFRNLWLDYHLSPTETDRLIDVLRQNLVPTVVNYRLRLRIPNQADHVRILTEELHGGLTQHLAKPADVLNRVATRWEQLWEGSAAEHKRDWIRFGVGLSR